MSAHNPEEQHVTPVQKAAAALNANNIDALLVGPGPDLSALSGWHTHPMERLTGLLVTKSGDASIILPRMEYPGFQSNTFDPSITPLIWDEQHGPWDKVAEALGSIGAETTIAIGQHLWGQYVVDLVHRFPGVHLAHGGPIMQPVRQVKTDDEIAKLRAAGAAIDRVHQRMGEVLKVGRTEKEVAKEIDRMMREEGHSVAEFIIVGAGENGASPHHSPTDRVINEGEAVVVDIGGPVDHYFSDCTRNYVMGHAPEGYDEAYRVLQASQAAGCAAVRPGIRAGEIDRICRSIIIDGGYGEYLLHRTGHGIGLEVHEDPYIFESNDTLLEPGMAFSVEPGIYKPGEWGMRIEDIVACTKEGGERLNTTSTDYVVL
ncbi:Xaa-Pro peptidase family protein [Stomatohabitans albus]|uniref:M24 family metallopeptidase n=1 Tax=Stomatohabitans albus TaxID=3110766 RepID=UPI00300CAA8C